LSSRIGSGDINSVPLNDQNINNRILLENGATSSPNNHLPGTTNGTNITTYDEQCIPDNTEGI